MSGIQRQTPSGDTPDSTTQPEAKTCQNCGSHVSRKFRRIFGDRENVAHRCYDCDSNTRLYRGSAAGKDVDRADPRNRDRQSADYERNWRTSSNN
ncbi:DUF7563 family protein [Haloarcula hispanica]|uniref:DUF7563 family protein n=1 Tax=Haloarcula hispanica TaxID=51589 RepID=UPI001CD953FB|nr:hypothetical protein [Haloarcula hispanica]